MMWTLQCFYSAEFRVKIKNGNDNNNSRLCVVCILHRSSKNPFNGPLVRSTRFSRYQKKHSPTHTLSLGLLQGGHKPGKPGILGEFCVSSGKTDFVLWVQLC